MKKISELVGAVVDGTPKFNREIDGEKFNTYTVDFKGTTIPILVSQYITDETFEPGTKLRVLGSLMSDISKGRLPVFYIYANSIDIVDIDTETTNEVNFSCTITKVREFKTDGRCVDILPLVASEGSPLNTTSVLYLCTKASLARKLKSKPKGYTLTGQGYLKAFRDVYEVYVTSANYD